METISGVSEGASDSGDLDPSVSTSGPAVVHVSIAGSIPPSVIQPSVIQTAGGTIQAIQLVNVGEGDHPGATEDDGTKKRREILARRPSYRKIFNELSGDPSNAITVTKIEEEDNSSQGSDSNDADLASGLSSSAGAVSSSGVQYQNATAGTITIGNAEGSGLQTLTMTNVNTSQGSPTAGATIVQYAQGPDGQLYIPGNYQSNIQYQIAPSSLSSQGVLMASPSGSTQGLGEDTTRKRELRLLKNKEAARECRRKKKEYIKCLENRVALLENQNKTLIEELKSLKELYCQKEQT